MLRILVLNDREENTAHFFEYMKELFTAERISSELLFTSNAERAISNILNDKYYYDVLILDCKKDTGLRTAGVLRKKSLIPAVIFLCPGGACETRELMRYRPSGLIYYDDPPELTGRTLLSVCREQISANPYFSLKNKDSIMRLPLADIKYFESSKRIVRVRTGSTIAEFYSKLSDVQSQLPTDEFVRCHQSYIVNLHAVSYLSRTEKRFVLDSGCSIEISKRYYSDTVSSYEAFTRNL